MNTDRVELRADEYPSPEDIDQFNNIKNNSWLFTPWARRIGTAGSIGIGALLTSCSAPGISNTPEPPPTTIAIVQESAPTPEATPISAIFTSFTEIARAIKRADDIRFLVQNYVREPLGNGLVRRFRDYDETLLATIMEGSSPRERNNFLIYHPISLENETRYVLEIDNTYEADGRLSQFSIGVWLLPSTFEDYVDENGRVSVDRLSSLALRVYRLPATPSGWAVFERQSEDETVTATMAVGITPRGRMFSVYMDTLARGMLVVAEPFHTPIT